MSEGSKMGLFGSKEDKNEPPSADTTKPDSPNRYAPYCIDSDSETYDTEALSIMDINDIIGVQTGQATESTLESEIAALTEIITDSKVETNSDTMNEIHCESSDAKFNEEMLTEFTSLSRSENSVATSSKKAFDEGLITAESEAKDVDEIAFDEAISESTNNTDDLSSKNMSEVEIDPKILDEVTTENQDAALCSVEQSNELNERKAESESENETKEESSPSPAQKSSDDAAKSVEVLVAQENEVPVKIDAATSDIKNSETEVISKAATDTLGANSATAKISSDEERIVDDKNSSKCEDAVKNTGNILEDVDSVLKTKSEEQEAVDDPANEKSTDILTNLGSTSKSLQLIGEAYISEDSQETDEQDESPVVMAASVPLPPVKEEDTVEKDDKLLEKGSSDNVSTDTLIDQVKINAIPDTLESAIEESDVYSQDSTPLEDKNEPDNTKEVLPNLEDNHEHGREASSAGSEINVPNEGDQVIEEDKSVDPSLRGDEHTDESAKLDQSTSLTTVSISTTTRTISMEEFVETQEKPLHENEQSEDIVSNSGAEAVETTTEDEVKLETNQNVEEIREETLDQPDALNEETEICETDVNTLNSNTDAVSEVDNFSTENPEPLKESEASLSLKTELENMREMDSEIQPEKTQVTKSVESPEPVDEQDNSTPVESNIEKELTDSQSNEESLSSLRHSAIEDKFTEINSESSNLPVEADTNSEDKDDQCATTTTSARKTISTEEQSEEKLQNVEELSESIQGNTEESVMDDTVVEKDTPLATEVTVDKKIEDKDENSCVHQMILSIRKAEEKLKQKMSIDSKFVKETAEDSSNELPTNKEDLATEESGDKVNKTENLEIELDQSASISSMENNTATSDITETNKEEDTVRDNLGLEKDNSTETESIELSATKLLDDQIEMEGHSGILRDAPESEIHSSITTEDVPGSSIGKTSEDITLANTELKGLETIELVSNEDNSNEAKTIQKSLESREICEAERAESETREEPEISETDEDVSKMQICDQIQQLKENQSNNEFAVDVDDKQAQDASDKDNTEIEENITEPSSETVADNAATVAELEPTSEGTTTQDPPERDSHTGAESEQEKDAGEQKIEVIEHQSDESDVLQKQQELENQSESTGENNEAQSPEVSHSNDKCNTSDVILDTKLETLSDEIVDEKQDGSKIQLEKLENEALLEESSQSVPCDELKEGSSTIESEADKDSAEKQGEGTCGSQILVKELEEMDSKSTVLEDVAESLEEEGELQGEKLLPIKPDENENSGDIMNIPLAEEKLELSETPSGTNQTENNSEGTVLNLLDETAPLSLQSDNLIVSDVKIDEDLQCEPIEDLEKLAVVADDILIDELANSVLKDVTQPLENINNLEILPDSVLSISTIATSEELKTGMVSNLSSEIKDQPVSILEEIDETCFIGSLDQPPSVSHGADYITDVIISSTNIDSIQLTDNVRDMDDENLTADEFKQRNQAEVVKISEDFISEDTTPVDESITDVSEACKLEIDEDLVLDKNIEIDLPLKQEEAKLIECAVLRACDAKIDLPDEVLFDTENVEQTDALCSTSADNADTSQQSSEFSELECAVKFLQESEEQTIDSPLLLSPKIAEEIVEENSEQSKSCLFLSETEVCQEALELPVELEEITPDSIAISEAEIISEAAKLESERKLKIAAEMSHASATIGKLDSAEKSSSENNSELLKSLLTTSETPSIWQAKSEEDAPSTSEKSDIGEIPKLAGNIIRRSEKIPKISILEERLKEPPKIEIPVPEGSPRISDTPTTPKTSLLIQRDSRMYQKMLESPKGGDKSEPKIADTPRKDSDKHDFENVGSPRIILKIAKSAIADCGEPRSPKSPKIRSAANSPNPEDSPGQKLGKIKLKLSKGGHPSIISNENFDETAQRHTEAILSPSHIGMKIKLSKTGDASIIQPEKHDTVDEIKESKHKFEEASPKRIESPLGMKIKLSKTGDPSIVQQESKESTSKRKDKLDIGQEIPKRTDSPIGMKIKLSKSGDASIIQPEKQETSEDGAYKDKFEIGAEIPKRTESPIGMKIKLSKTGDASIISSDNCEDYKDSSSKSREKSANIQDIPKRTDSPLGMKFKLSKSGGASIIQPEKSESFDDVKEKSENIADITKRVESPIGMKIKLLKTGDASIIHPDKQESDEHRESIITKHREKSETQEIHKRTDSPLGMRIKVTKTGEASVVPPDEFRESSLMNTDNFDIIHEAPKRNESPIGMKIKLSKSGDASIIHPEKQESSDESKDCRVSSSVHQEGSKSTESSLGMKIKLSKTGDASIIHPEISPESKDAQFKRTEKLQTSGEGSKRTDSPLGMKIKLSKTGDASIIEPDKKEKLTTKQKEKLTSTSEASPKRKEMEYPLEMKIKLSKTGHPTIIANEKQESLAELHLKSKDHYEGGQSTYHKRAESTSPARDPQLRIFKTGHSTIIQSHRSEVTIEPIQMLQERPESSLETSPKCKEVSISPVEHKKSKLEAKLSHILPEVTIQPVMSGEQKQIILDKKSSSISRQQMSVINQEISITQVSPTKPADLSMSGKLKEILRKNATNSPGNSDCEIIEHRPELIIVNENSNSSQDIMIIEEVKAPLQEVKIPRKRGRPKRSALPPGQPLMRQGIPQDPLALDNMQPSASAEHRESDRPKRTCRNQKSYAPPKRGRGRGRGKRKMDRMDCAIGKIPRLEDPLTAIEISTMSLIAPLQTRVLPEQTQQTSELYKALKQSPAERKRLIAAAVGKHGFTDAHKKLKLESEPGAHLASGLPPVPITGEHSMVTTNVDASIAKITTISEILHLAEPTAELHSTEKLLEAPKPEAQETKSIISDITTTEHQNWLTPSIRLPETTGKTEAISMVQVMDEETRMSAESNSRSQTPARNISIPVVETVINEESQGSVLSTATTESEKVKVKNRRMEINFDPDEGPFTVDKIAEYEWPPDRKGDTFMIQEQISQYLGVKSFKRKYPDLKRRMVEMEERNFLRENCLVSEAMCDMGLTAICSTEVLDIMCSDFPDQYEEYRKHMREKQAKEHSKKQKELTAAANAERNRIDLAEMAVQSALSWNVNFNKARKESRKYSLDLQSFTIHVPKKQLKVDAERKASNYPVALIPGQYTDYYREYTPAELRYYPLNTVLYGPMRPNERKFDSQSEGSQSDSDSDSSSDDSSSSSSEGTQDTEESQSTVDEVDMEIAAHKEDNKNLKCKMCLKHLNKHGKAEVLIQCGTCNGNVHPSCIDLTLDMVPHIQGYSWQCTDCKTCVQCHNPADEDKMLFCDMCDRGYHIYCVGLRRVPQGRWHCRECAVCASCGLRQPGGANSDRNSVAQWQHEYKKGERNTRVYVSTLCVPCSKLWRKGRYCPHCSRCHSAQRLDLEPNLVHCSACDKYLHLGCVEIRSGTLDRKNYICECCSTPGQLSRSLMSKNFKT